jgi:hypothetical protein
MQTWEILFADDFEKEFDGLSKTVQNALYASLILLEKVGPHLKRPYVDTLKGSKHPNMKELRFDADDGVWRVLFAFDPVRQAILLAAGDKSGSSEKRFYKDLITKADKRFDAYLTRLKEATK